MGNNEPLVSVILTTHDRPHLLPVALSCFKHQTYANRELIVVDDGIEHPVAPDVLGDAPSVRVLRLDSKVPLGIKLNRGIDAAAGKFCMKMDDDDWYAPTYLETSMRALLESQTKVYRPTIVFHVGFLFFELGTWRLHQSTENNAPGATLIFAKEDWRRRPFRPVPTDEDVWFYRDQIRAGAVPLPIDALENYIAIRHHGHRGTFGHTWTHQLDGSMVEDYLAYRPLYKKAPEDLLPAWALDTYRRIHEEIVETAAEAPAAYA